MEPGTCNPFRVSEKAESSPSSSSSSSDGTYSEASSSSLGSPAGRWHRGQGEATCCTAEAAVLGVVTAALQLFKRAMCVYLTGLAFKGFAILSLPRHERQLMHSSICGVHCTPLQQHASMLLSTGIGTGRYLGFAGNGEWNNQGMHGVRQPLAMSGSRVLGLWLVSSGQAAALSHQQGRHPLHGTRQATKKLDILESLA